MVLRQSHMQAHDPLHLLPVQQACETPSVPQLDRSSDAVELHVGITIGNIQNVMGVLYSSTNYQGMFNLQNVLPVVGYERSVFYR